MIRDLLEFLVGGLFIFFFLGLGFLASGWLPKSRVRKVSLFTVVTLMVIFVIILISLAQPHGSD